MLRVATWNICHGSAPGRGAVPRRDLLDAVASLDADVLAVQEIERRSSRSRFTDQIRAVSARTAMQSTFARTTRVGLTGDYGIALFTRASHRATVHELPREGASEQRCAIEAVVDAPVGALTVLATHFSTRREESEQQLAFVLSRARASDGPVIVLGDLNRRPHEVLDRVEAAGLTVIETGPTYVPDPSAPPTLRIDYLAVRGLAAVGDAEVRVLPLSDHAAVAASLTLAPPI